MRSDTCMYIHTHTHIYIYIYHHHHHHHHVMTLARISLNLSRHFPPSFIAFGRSSGLHPTSSHSCCMYVRDGRPAFAWPYAGVHGSIYIYIYIYLHCLGVFFNIEAFYSFFFVLFNYLVKNENESDLIKKLEKRCNSKEMILCYRKNIFTILKS